MEEICKGVGEVFKDTADSDVPHHDVPRLVLTLRNVELFYSTEALRVNEQIGENPYRCTKPLRESDFPLLSSEGLPRSRVADDVRRSVLRGENVALVGAHRVGKSSLLTLIESKLRDEALCVRINAAVTPPEQLSVSIIDQLSRDFKKWRRLRGPLTRYALDLGGRLRREDRPVRTWPKTGLADLPDGEQLTKEVHEEETTALQLHCQSIRRGVDTLRAREGALSLLTFLMESMRALRRLVTEPTELVVVVIVDEVGDMNRWRTGEALPAWRHLLESDRFDGLRWIISTSLPVRESTDYSPITNAFREYNLDALDGEETDRLIDAITHPPHATLRPVITLGARRLLHWVTSRLPFLLQTCLYHLFEEMRGGRLPVITTRVCHEVLTGPVLRDLSDYFAGQWAQLPDEVRAQVVEQTRRLDPGTLFRTKNLRVGSFKAAPPSFQKALLRSGLTAPTYDDLVAPLVARWLLDCGHTR